MAHAQAPVPQPTTTRVTKEQPIRSISITLEDKAAYKNIVNWQGTTIPAGTIIGQQVVITGGDRQLSFTEARNVSALLNHTIQEKPGGETKKINGKTITVYCTNGLFLHQQDKRGPGITMDVTNNVAMQKFITYVVETLTTMDIPQINQPPADATIDAAFLRQDIRLALYRATADGANTDASVHGNAQSSIQWAIDLCPSLKNEMSESIVSMTDLKNILWPVIDSFGLTVYAQDATNNFILLPHDTLLQIMASE